MRSNSCSLNAPAAISLSFNRLIGHFSFHASISSLARYPGTGYRAKDEIEAWKEKCPIKRLKERLIAAGAFSEQEFERIRDAVYADLNAIAARAEAAPLPAKKVDLDGIFAVAEMANG